MAQGEIQNNGTNENKKKKMWWWWSMRWTWLGLSKERCKMFNTYPRNVAEDRHEKGGRRTYNNKCPRPKGKMVFRVDTADFRFGYQTAKVRFTFRIATDAMLGYCYWFVLDKSWVDRNSRDRSNKWTLLHWHPFGQILIHHGVEHHHWNRSQKQPFVFDPTKNHGHRPQFHPARQLQQQHEQQQSAWLLLCLHDQKVVPAAADTERKNPTEETAETAINHHTCNNDGIAKRNRTTVPPRNVCCLRTCACASNASSPPAFNPTPLHRIGLPIKVQVHPHHCIQTNTKQLNIHPRLCSR